MNAMAEVGADPALIYAFRKTGVYVCPENEKSLSPSSMRAFNAHLTTVVKLDQFPLDQFPQPRMRD